MKKKTAVVIFLCFVCVAVIGICAMAGISKWQEHQTELQRQQRLDAYSDDLRDAFDDLYDVETSLLDDMAQQSAQGVSNREIMLSAIEAMGAPIDTLASVEAPEEAADAQRHFASAAKSYHAMADVLTELLEDNTANADTVKGSLIDMLPDAIDAFDQLKYGIQALEDSGVISLPDSAIQLEKSLDSLIDSGIGSMLTSPN
ncbi:MAG: hypothetical protein LUE11_05765 [Clostridia bacterium]|nr:hypothetical protein [Clostridia bacterium]